MEFSVVETDCGLIRVGLAVEYENTGLWLLGCHKEVEREGRTATALEAAYPFVWPPVDFLHGVGHERLLRGENGTIHSPRNIFFEFVVDILGLSSLKSEDGGVTDGWAFAEDRFMPFNPVVNDAVLTRLVIKETVDVIHDNNIYIHEKGGAFQVGKAILEYEEFYIDIRPFGYDSGIFREGFNINAFIESCGIIGDADKTKRSVKVFFD